MSAGRRAEELDEESRGLLRQIVERQAWRAIVLANIRGHGQKFLPGVGERRAFANDLAYHLETLEVTEDVHRRLGGEDLYLTVRGRLEDIPYPASRLELGLCLLICELAERVAATGYRASSCEDIARLAERSLAAKWEGSRGELEFLSEFCADEGNRPRVREVFDNWFAIAERSFGRPGSAGDERAVALGLRTSSAGDTAEEFRSRVGEFAGDCGLQ
ncbi:MAG: hypothetical protein CMK00_03435 [Planctomycetes bacterium]|jgi:hypothetical protein|nr:hypothetical protein [Planctomycetota bacterium]HJO26921.1 hypothetical protein [Planctomycetota bacterium]